VVDTDRSEDEAIVQKEKSRSRERERPNKKNLWVKNVSEIYLE